MLQRTLMATLFFALSLFFFGKVADAAIWTSVEYQVLAEINEERALVGENSLKPSGLLARVADRRCTEIVKTFNHNGFGAALTALGVKRGNYVWLTEVIGRGQSTPQQFVAGLMGSVSHRARILDKIRYNGTWIDFNVAGAARCTYGATTYGWVVVLGDTR